MSSSSHSSASSANPADNPRLIAFFLTQFHPTPQNNRWWGKGFTEWTNVTKAAPLYEGHYQPHLPSDMGFYDLRLRQTRHEQIALAKQYGIGGFCYHYYWFSGERILNEPLDDMLADPQSDMPFCLCWANENWTRRWDGADHEILMEQKYRPIDDENFIRDLLPVLQDPRYIRVDGKPFLIVYNPQHMPNAKASSEVWRKYCREQGLGEIHICAALTHRNEDYVQFGFDSGVEFPPHNVRAPNISAEVDFFQPFYGTVMQYADVAASYVGRQYKGGNVFKTVFPSWDNAARTKARAVAIANGVPDNYEFWLSSTVDAAKAAGQDLVFINAWNEWAEGCHLEPDRRFGHGFLEATARVLAGERRFTSFPVTTHPSPKTEQPVRGFYTDLAEVLSYHSARALGKLRTFVSRRPLLRAMALPMVRVFNRLRAKR